MMDRRTFLAVTPLAVALGGRVEKPAGAGRRLGARPLAPIPERLGVQLYTLRTEMAQAPDRTLAAIAEIGYQEVELAGLYGMSPRVMRTKLDAVGLRAASSHHGLGEVREGWDRVLDGAAELGQSLVVVPSIDGRERTAEGLRRVADDFNTAGESARAAGLRFGYHNHDWEMRPFPDGTVPMDLLLARTERDAVDWQMDLFWTVHGGADPYAYLARTSGRVTSVHVKDRTASGDMVDVGDGVIDFARLLDDAERRGLRHAFVEHDRPADALESVRRSYRHLAGLRAAAGSDGRTSAELPQGDTKR